MTKWKDSLYILGFVVMLAVTLLGWNKTSNESAAKDALQQSDIDRLKTEWGQYDFGVFEYKLDEMDEKLDKMITLVEAL